MESHKNLLTSNGQKFFVQSLPVPNRHGWSEKFQKLKWKWTREGYCHRHFIPNKNHRNWAWKIISLEIWEHGSRDRGWIQSLLWRWRREIKWNSEIPRKESLQTGRPQGKYTREKSKTIHDLNHQKSHWNKLDFPAIPHHLSDSWQRTWPLPLSA